MAADVDSVTGGEFNDFRYVYSGPAVRIGS